MNGRRPPNLYWNADQVRGLLLSRGDQATLTPAVPIKKSVRKETIVCLECGRSAKMLKPHLSRAHGLGVNEYRERWKLPADYPMVSPNYAAVRSELAKKIGLGRKRWKR